MSNDFRAEIDVSVKGADSITAAQKAVLDLDKALLSAAESAQKLDTSMKSTAKGAGEVAKSSQKVTSAMQETGAGADEMGRKSKKAGGDMEQSWKSQKDSLSNTRYALYDVAAMYKTVGIAAAAMTAATVGVAASYEKSFANVARTTMATGEELANIRENLIGLSQVSPVSYDDITNIASLGAQLGIANKDLTNFTETISMFSAATDVTVDNAAMKLGRISQLTQTAGSEMDNLASSIYYTGINAVATEGQILAVAEQIATAGNLAGMANYEVIALASALASLGVAPEAARGSMMRIFANLESAIEGGGAELEQFASISGKTSASLQENWGTNTQQVFTDFILGLENIKNAGGSVNQTLKDVGIVSIRDVKAIQLLLNNSEVYLQAQADTAQSYKENTALSEGFAIQTDTLVDTVLKLKNNLAAIVAEGTGFTDFLKFGIGVLNDILKVVADLARTPLGKIMIGLAGGVAMAVGAWASFHVAINLARGGLAAFVTAQIGLQKSNIKLNVGLFQLAREFFAVARGGEAATARLITTGSAMNSTAVSARNAAASTGLLSKSLGLFTKGNLIMIGLGLAVTGATVAWKAYSESQKSASDKAKEHFGDLSGLAEALAKDTEAGDDSLRQYSVSAEDAAKSSFGLSTELERAADGTITLKGASEEVSAALENQIVLMGELSKQAIAQLVVGSIGADWDKYGATLRSVGFDIDEYMAKAVLMDGSAEKYAAGFEIAKSTIEEMSFAVRNAVTDAQDAVIALEQSGKTTGTAYEEATLKLEQAYDALDKFVDSDMGNIEGVNEAVKSLTKSAELIDPAVDTAANSMLLMDAAAKVTGESLQDAANDGDDLGNELDKLTDKVKAFGAAASNELAIADMFYNMGESLQKNGLEFNTFTQDGIANMQMLESSVNQLAAAAGDDSEMFIGNVLAMMGALEAQGVQVGSEFDWVYQSLTNLIAPEYGINLNTAVARQNAINLINDLIAVERQIAAMNNQRSSSSPFNDPSRSRVKNSVDTPDNTEKLNKLVSLQRALSKANDQTVPAVKNVARGYEDAARAANKTGGGKGGKSGTGKVAKDTKDAAKAAKDLKKEMRTSADYASDLAGVFGDINDLVFGLGDASRTVRENFQDLFEDLAKDAGEVRNSLFQFDRKEAKDGIAKSFIDLKQAASDAKKEVRDAVLAVQDAQAKLQGDVAEGSTLAYQLSVAKALGTAERIAEVEAKIAQNQADRIESTNAVTDAIERQKKAQAATSTSTTGDSEVSIDNRGKLRALASSYMDYADKLREAGVSGKDVSKYTKQAEKDFIAQGEALGFNDKQLKEYSVGIVQSSGEIERNSTSLKNNEAALTDLYRTHVDAVTAFAATGASQKEVAAFAKESERQFYSQARQLGFNTTELGKYRTAWEGVHTTIKKLPSAVTIKANVNNPSDAALRKFFTDWNNKQLSIKIAVDDRPAKNWRDRNTGGKGTSAGVGVPVKPAMDSYSTAKVARGLRTLISLSQRVAKVTNLMRNPSIGNLGAIASNVAVAVGLANRLASGSYAAGGYTGRGSKYEEAGTVHKGEFVFPKSDVDQNTGLPNTQALYAMLGKSVGLNMGKQMPTVSGEVMNRQPMPQQAHNPIQPVELLPNQMVQLAQMIGRQVPVGPSLSDTTLAVNRINSTRTGKGQG